MAHGVEGRHPFLDRRVRRAAQALELRGGVGRGHQKRVLRAYVQEVIDPDLARVPKRGFAFPVDVLYRGALRGTRRGPVRQPEHAGSRLRVATRRDARDARPPARRCAAAGRSCTPSSCSNSGPGASSTAGRSPGGLRSLRAPASRSGRRGPVARRAGRRPRSRAARAAAATVRRGRSGSTRVPSARRAPGRRVGAHDLDGSSPRPASCARGLRRAEDREASRPPGGWAGPARGSSRRARARASPRSRPRPTPGRARGRRPRWGRRAGRAPSRVRLRACGPGA